jgi:hypothetical protein
MLQRPDRSGDLYSITVASDSLDRLRTLLDDPDVDPGCRPMIQRAEEGGFHTVLIITNEKLRELEQEPRFRVTIRYNATEEGRKRQQEVGQGDRFEQGRVVPRGYGRKV